MRLRAIFDRVRGHRNAREMPGYIRRRMYRQLLEVVEQERRVAELLGTSVRPRLSVVDEERVAIIRPSDRSGLDPDKEMGRARKEKSTEETRSAGEQERR